MSQSEVESLIGPFQSSPLSLAPKASDKEKYRLVQNLSFPRTPSSQTVSINSCINSDMYPSTWGTFDTICLTAWRLPPDSQGAVREVAEAYRTIGVTPTQWPGPVVRLRGSDSFAIDTADCFGLQSSSGIYGVLTDASDASRLDAARHGLRLGASKASRNAAVYQWAEHSEYRTIAHGGFP